MSYVFRVFILLAASVALGHAFTAYAALPREYVRIKASDFDRGYVRGQVSSGEVFDFTAPLSASCSTNASLRGGATDYARIRLPWWRFRLGKEEYSEIVALGDGTVWLSEDVSIPSVFTPLGIVPSDTWSTLSDSCAATCPPLGITTKTKLSVIWHEVTLDSVKITWQNALLSRDPTRPISYQVELFRNGDFTARLDLSRVPAGDRVFIYTRNEFGVARPTSVRWHRLTAEDMADADIDGDGIDTEREILDYGTDPRSHDTDGDSASDSQEVSWGTKPVEWDTDWDGFGDATDPHPLSHNAWKDADGDGFPDTWRKRWFGTGVIATYADPGGDGIQNIAALHIGVSPRESRAAGTAVPEFLPQNMNAYLFAPTRFLFTRSDAVTNLVTRTFTVDRTSPWQQLLLMSDLNTYAGWTASDVEIRWEAGNESGVAPLDTWNSFRIPVSHTNTFKSVRLSIVATGPVPRLSAPIYLVRWIPVVSLSTAWGSRLVSQSPDVYMVHNDYSDVYSLPCTATPTGYPRVGGLEAVIEEALAFPVLPGVSLKGDRLVFSGVGTVFMPQQGTQDRVKIIVYHMDWHYGN